MKKFFSAILLMTMMVFSVGTFVSCNDLVEEVETIKGQTTDIENAIAGLETEIAALETALQNAKAEAADAAKKAADAAAAADAKAADAAAAAAAAQAAADALAGQLETAQATLQAALDGKADVEDVEAAVKAIEALQAALDGKYDKTDAAALEARVKLLEDAVANYKTLIEELEIAVGYNLEAITNLDFAFNQFKEGEYADLAEAVAELEELVNACNTNLTNYDAAILGIVEMIQSVVYVPETAEGTMVATGYQMGNSKSDLIVKATYEVTPAKYAAELTNANLSFTAVPVTKAAAAEVVAAELVEPAANGRVTVYGRIKANTETYKALTGNTKDAALALVITDEASATVDSTAVTVGTNVKSAYTTVKAAVAGAYVQVPNLVKVYDNVTGKWVTGANNDNVNTLKVPYTDTEVKSPLAKYELRFDIQGKKMTAAEASTFLGYTVATTIADQNYVTYADASNTAVVPSNTVKVPFKVTPNHLATTVQLQPRSNTQPLKGDINWSTTAVLSTYKVNNTPVGTQAVSVTGKVIIDYTAASDVTFATHNAAAWSYKTFESASNRHNYVLPSTVISTYAYEAAVTLPDGVTMNDLRLRTATNGTVALGNSSANVTTIDLKSSYVDQNGQTQPLTGSFSFYVLSEKAVKITAIDVPYWFEAKDYVANFDLVDTRNNANKVYTTSFTVKVGARPADAEINLGDLTYNGTLYNGASVKVPAIAKVLEQHGTFYASLQTDFNNKLAQYDATGAMNLVNTRMGTPVKVTNGGSKVTLTTPNYTLANTAIVETAAVVADAPVNTYGSEYPINNSVMFAGIKYTFKGKLTVNKPNYGVKLNALLINPSTQVGDVLGTIVYPTTSANRVTAGTPFALNAIDLRDYVVVTDNGANAAETLLNSGEFKLKYELISTYDHDRNPYTDEVVIPGVTFNGGATSALLGSALNATNPVVWADNNGYASAKFKVTLVSAYADKANGTDEDFGSVEFTLQIPDLVKIETASKIPSEEFVPGTQEPVVINLCEAIKVTDFNGKSLIGKKADALNTLWAETKTGTTYGNEWYLYGQSVNVVNNSAWNLVPEAVVESTGDKLYYGTDYTVDQYGNVQLLLTDLNIQSNVVVTVPLMLSHVYADGNDATNIVLAKVKFTPAK